jgi:hypothetical protein
VRTDEAARLPAAGIACRAVNAGGRVRYENARPVDAERLRGLGSSVCRLPH